MNIPSILINTTIAEFKAEGFEAVGTAYNQHNGTEQVSFTFIRTENTEETEIGNNQ